MIEKSGSPGFRNLSGVALCQVLGEGIRVPRCSDKTEARKEPLTVCKMFTCISYQRNANKIHSTHLRRAKLERLECRCDSPPL